MKIILLIILACSNILIAGAKGSNYKSLAQLNASLNLLYKRSIPIMQDIAFTKKREAERAAELKRIADQKSKTIAEGSKAAKEVEQRAIERGKASIHTVPELPEGRVREIAEKLKLEQGAFPRTRPVGGYGFEGRGTAAERKETKARREAREAAARAAQ